MNNNIKEGEKRKMLNYDINKNDNKDKKEDNNTIPIVNNTYNYYKECYNTNNSNNEYDYSNYNNKYGDCKWEIPLKHEIDNNGNYKVMNKRQISEEDIKNSKVYRELEEKYNNKVKECDNYKKYIDQLKDNMNYINNTIIQKLLKYKENKPLDTEYSNMIVSIMNKLSLLFKNNNNTDNLPKTKKDGE